MDDFKPNQYGIFSFTITRKRSKKIYKTGFVLRAEITDMDKNNLELTDNDGIVYYPAKKDVKSFEEKPKP